MEWRVSVYLDSSLPFGLRSAPRLFNVLADLLSWFTTSSVVSFSIHYLDDYLTVGPASFSTCQPNLDYFKTTCRELGISLALEKEEGRLPFLVLVLDTQRMEICLSDYKLERIRDEVTRWLQQRSATRSLVGLLQHATKVMKKARTFVARM